MTPSELFELIAAEDLRTEAALFEVLTEEVSK